MSAYERIPHNIQSSEEAIWTLHLTEAPISQMRSPDGTFWCAPDALSLPENQVGTLHLIAGAVTFGLAYRSLMEAARVLSPGGGLQVRFAAVPQPERAARFVSAVYGYAGLPVDFSLSSSEWTELLIDAGFAVQATSQVRRTYTLADCASLTSHAAQERLHVLLLRAPQAVSDYLQPEYAGTPYVTFSAHDTLIEAIRAD